MYCNWIKDIPELANQHINIKELAAVLVAVDRWKLQLRKKHLVVYMDNMAAIAMINKGSSRHPMALKLLKQLAASALMNDFTIEAVHIPGLENELPDAISRLHQPDQIQRFLSLYQLQYAFAGPHGFWLCNHMSYHASLLLYPQIKKWIQLLHSWMPRSEGGDNTSMQNQQSHAINPTSGHISVSANLSNVTQFQ